MPRSKTGTSPAESAAAHQAGSRRPAGEAGAAWYRSPIRRPAGTARCRPRHRRPRPPTFLTPSAHRIGGSWLPGWLELRNVAKRWSNGHDTRPGSPTTPTASPPRSPTPSSGSVAPPSGGPNAFHPRRLPLLPRTGYLRRTPVPRPAAGGGLRPARLQPGDARRRPPPEPPRNAHRPLRHLDGRRRRGLAESPDGRRRNRGPDGNDRLPASSSRSMSIPLLVSQAKKPPELMIVTTLTGRLGRLEGSARAGSGCGSSASASSIRTAASSASTRRSRGARDP